MNETIDLWISMPYTKVWIPLVLGFLLDAIVGDPYKMPHPIRLFGNTIAFCEKRWNQGIHKKRKGAFVAVCLILATGILFYTLIFLSSLYTPAYYVLSTIFVFYGVANRNLIDEALKVEHALGKSIEKGRKQVAMIVGRDTSSLNEHQIRTATLETLAENLSDGVIAPLFYYLIGGIPLLFVYKMINTLDSMIGYKTERYKSFGFLAAKIDDVANYIPARITALLMVGVTLSWRGILFVTRYGNKHASPNSGYPEAALAGILNCRFGGPNIYHGEWVKKPFIGEMDRKITTKDLYKACGINFLSTLLFIALSVGLLFFIYRI